MITTTESLQAWLVSRVAALRGLDPRSIDTRERFSRYGLDSLGAGRLVGELATLLGRPLSPTLVWERPTIEALAAHLSGAEASAATAPVEASGPRDEHEPIAIVGMACRFPKAPDLASFWALLAGGVDAITEVPKARGWDEVLLARGVESDERARVRRGGFLDAIDGFDPLFFGISPREASAMDPQQRLLLELCWEALEDAAIRPSSLRGSRTAVFAGAIWSDYAFLLYQGGPEALGRYTVTGYHHSILANRISYVFGLEGPSFTIDSACSSGLVVSHLACESLRRGESTLALACAANLNVLAESALAVSRFGALSADGHCYTFDARANGYVRGEGGGVVALKTLSRAIADGDRIYGVIRTSAVNNDGASNGLTAPSRHAQESVLRDAYGRSGVDVASVQYVEAHGTGTPLGDPIEARALGSVIGEARAAGSPLLVGSAKTNIGHLEGAAGIVGITKMALAIQHRLLPPSLNFATSNPHAPLAELGLAVPTTLGPWPAPERRLVAGVSSFGLGGTNGHVVIEEWPAPPTEVLALSTASPEALRVEVEAERARLARDAGTTPLRDLCARSTSRCETGAHRLAVVARSHGELTASLTAFLAGEASAEGHASGPATFDAQRGVVFVFPGQGAQWYGMARSLLQSEPVFRATIKACDRLARPHLGWSLIDELTSARASSRLDAIDVSLPAIIAIDIALAAWWRSMGVEPSAVVGHSTGEIAAAHVAGALDLADTMRVICAYGRLIARQAGHGSMALVGLPWDDVGAALVGFEGQVFRAIQDSPGGTVIAGEPGAVARLLEALQGKGVFCRRVNMNVAPHCPLADSLRGELFESLRTIKPRRGSVALISEVTGDEIPGEALDAAHWVRNFGDQAFFARAVGTLIERGHRVFLDVGPHPITAHSVEASLRHAGAEGVVLSSMRRDEDERATQRTTLATLHARGLPVRWSELYSRGSDEASRGETWVLPISARSPGALAALALAYAALLQPGAADVALHDIAYTASARRDHHPHRLAVVGRSRGELTAALAAFAKNEAAPGLFQGRAPIARAAKIVFVFPGQGSQWIGMGRQLLADEPAFREAIEACDAAVAREAGFSVLAEIAADEATSRLAAIDVVQPLLFAIEIALAALWRSWGVEPDAVVGHSMGEVAAAHVAGILGLDDAAKVICRRSRLLRRVSGQGAMALVELALPDAEDAIRGLEDRLSIAVSNAPRSTVISGDPAAIEQVLAALEKQGVFCRRVKVDVASHSPQMDPLRDELLASLREIRPRTAQIAMRSTVTGELVKGPELDASYWVKNLRAPVLFSTATQALATSGHGVFLELSPHPILLPAIEENLREAGQEGAAIGSTRRDAEEARSLREALAAAYACGVDIDWKQLFPRGGRRVALPGYAWQREAFWPDPAPTRATSLPRRSAAKGRDEHPLLGPSFEPSRHPGERCWEQWLSVDEIPYIVDHQVGADVVFPGAAYVEMALAAGAQRYGGASLALEAMSFERMLVLPAGARRLAQVTLTDEGSGRAAIEIATRAEGDEAWTRHAVGKLHLGAATARATESPSLIQARCPAVIEGTEHYAAMAERGLRYGARFRGVERLWVGARESIARVSLPPELTAEAGAYLLHPALLDACLQTTLALASRTVATGTMVPVSLAHARLHGRLPEQVWVHVRIPAEGSTPDGGPSFDLRILDANGRVLAEIGALRLVLLAAKGTSAPDGDDCVYTVSWRQKPLPAAPSSSGERGRAGAWLVVLDSGGLGASVGALLRARGETCFEAQHGATYQQLDDRRWQIDTTRAADLDRLFVHVFDRQRPCRGVIHCASLDAAPWAQTTDASLEADLRRGTLAAVAIAQALLRRGDRDPPRLVLVTRGAQSVGALDAPVSVAQAPLWGLGRTLALEHPELECLRIDLSPRASPGEADLLVREIVASDGEDQIALRDEGRFAARLTRSRFEPDEGSTPRLEPANGRPFRLEIREPGVLERLSLREIERRPPGPGEVEIEVEAAGLNFLDVLLTLGALPERSTSASGPPLGSECAGRIVAVGPDVHDLAPGAEVVALATMALGTHAIARRELVVPKPPQLSWDEAATLPIAFLTAYHALAHVARLDPGERVLIHAGTGGVGMAAIQWAQRVGAQIFATAGSHEKRELLRSLGIVHVMDSRSSSFVDDVRKATNGEGVDVVLNSLSGELIAASFGLLRDHGRFVEIGKKDYHENRHLGLQPFLRNLSFSLVDLRGMIERRPGAVAEMLREVVALVAAGELRPLPCRGFPASAAKDAFGLMAKARHVGKIAIQMRERGALIAPREVGRVAIVADGSYLITGGLGGLGLVLARRLVANGARHLALVGRSAPSEAAWTAIRALEAAGAAVAVLRGDVTRAADVERIVHQIEHEMPALRGVVHAAAVLDDRTLVELGESHFWAPVRPKVLGAWNLHVATRGAPLDFFVMYSSVAALMGSPGQAAYGASNAFLDGLAEARTAEGLVAMSVQWGPFAGVGLAAAQENRGQRLSSQGFEGFEPDEGTDLLFRLLRRPRAVVSLLEISWRQWLESNPRASGMPFLAELENEQSIPRSPGAGSGDFRALLDAATASDRTNLLLDLLLEQLGRVVRLDPSRIERRAPFTSLGVDSLTSMELRNRLESKLGLQLSAALLFTHPTPAALAAHLMSLLYPANPSPPALPVSIVTVPGHDLEDLGADDLLAMLDQELSLARKNDRTP